MLIRFTVSNYLSFKDAASLNMVKSRERQLPGHICQDKVNGFNLLRGAVLYGPNASGKSNFLTAMMAAQAFIIVGKPIKQNRVFRLDRDYLKKPSSFEFDFTFEGKAFSYGFEVYKGNVVAEYLYVVGYKKKDKIVFERSLSENETKISIGNMLEKKAQKSLSDLEFLIRTTPKDILFCTHLSKLDLDADIPEAVEFLLLSPVLWCRNKLNIINLQDTRPQSELLEMMQGSDDFREEVVSILAKADPGILSIRLEKSEVSIKSFLEDIGPGPKILEKWDELKDNIRILFSSPNNRRRYVVTRIDGEYSVERIVIIRENSHHEEEAFELNEESEGTRRIIDLTPIFFGAGEDETIVIDEMERSLHPAITKLFHDQHYSKSECQNRQLIIATHEHHLLSQDHYRRDEIWFTQKKRTGETELYSLNEFDGLRFDKDIRKDYLLGRYGAIPKL